jgi:hypothetical protein
MPELFVQLRQVTIGLSQIRGLLQCLLICREGSACILLILEDHCEVEMRECGVRPIRQGTAVARLGFVEMTGVMIGSPRLACASTKPAVRGRSPDRPDALRRESLPGVPIVPMVRSNHVRAASALTGRFAVAP